MPDDVSLNRRTLLKLGATVGAGLALPAVGAAQLPTSANRPAHLIIRHATVLSMEPDAAVMNDTDVRLRDGRIVALGKGLPGEGAEVIDATGMILIPGLVDSHWHLWNSLLRNSAPAPGGEAFFKSQLAISKRFTPQMSALGVRLGLLEAVNGGITTVNNWAHNLRNPAFAQAELNAMFASGLRGRFWYGYAQDLDATAAMNFADIQRVHAQLQSTPESRVDLGIAIRGPERTQPDVWGPEFAFAKANGLPISTHIAVTAKTQKEKAVQQLADKGVLGPAVQLVHATHVDAQDIATIAQSGASVCLTPLTEMRVGYGLAQVDALHRAKIPVTLGIDTLVLSGNANPFMVMQTLLNLAVGISGNEQALTACDVVFWATQGAANAMGLGSQIGSITPGKRADLTLIDARRVGMMPVLDPYASVVQSTTPADVDTVIADGRVLKRGGHLLSGDSAALGREITVQLKALGVR
ncbi:amidohydrolase family protein [Pseudomonas sp. LP_7_YM]|uniref:amidohydrolase family protein n=1 Tax=Pseudomonas sp. LP_7_YM TaxID=2485137 RepID=UPI0010604086|nr:amidohydrolase family protein [Pseudomonas sp. LP_7_YM]TDV72501.1 cytosine/adenosine deaminase-related metal-dependent hydrolase [Pseudomonas sp. LP_7_YM]